MGDQPVAIPLPIQDSTNREKMQTSIPRVGFEPTIQVFEWVKTFRALDLATTMISN
jgi:hypothetical protein